MLSILTQRTAVILSVCGILAVVAANGLIVRFYLDDIENRVDANTAAISAADCPIPYIPPEALD